MDFHSLCHEYLCIVSKILLKNQREKHFFPSLQFIYQWVKCKKDLTPLPMHWSYVFLALTHRYLNYTKIVASPIFQPSLVADVSKRRWCLMMTMMTSWGWWTVHRPPNPRRPSPLVVVVVAGAPSSIPWWDGTRAWPSISRNLERGTVSASLCWIGSTPSQVTTRLPVGVI